MASGKMNLTTVVDLIQETYRGALSKTLSEVSDAYNRLMEKGKVRTFKGLNIKWPCVSSGVGDASNIPDGGTLPSSVTETYDEATLNYAIYIEMLRVGRLLKMGSVNKDEFYSEQANALMHLVQRAIPQMARTIHKHIVAETDTTYGLTGLGSAAGTDDNTYAGIDRSTATYWAPYVNDNSGTNRTLTEAYMMDVFDTLTETRDSEPNEIWCGVTAWNALSRLVGTSQTQANYAILHNNAEDIRAGAITIHWKGIPCIRMRNMDTNAMYFLNFEDGSEGTGIELLRQHDDDFIVTPESTNAYDECVSIAGHYQLVVWNPWKQGALKDVQ